MNILYLGCQNSYTPRGIGFFTPRGIADLTLTIPNITRPKCALH